MLLLKKYLKCFIQESGIVNNFEVFFLGWFQMSDSQWVLWERTVLFQAFLILEFLIPSKLCKLFSWKVFFKIVPLNKDQQVSFSILHIFPASCKQ